VPTLSSPRSSLRWPYPLWSIYNDLSWIEHLDVVQLARNLRWTAINKSIIMSIFRIIIPIDNGGCIVQDVLRYTTERSVL
jgi:hypothetical protein